MCEIFLSFLRLPLFVFWLRTGSVDAGPLLAITTLSSRLWCRLESFALYLLFLGRTLFLFSRIASHPTFRSSFWTSFLKVGECILRSLYHFFTGGSAGTDPGR